MKYPPSEKLEIIRLVEQSHLSVRRTLAKIGVSRPTFYRWYDLYRRMCITLLSHCQGGQRRHNVINGSLNTKRQEACRLRWPCLCCGRYGNSVASMLER